MTKLLVNEKDPDYFRNQQKTEFTRVYLMITFHLKAMKTTKFHKMTNQELTWNLQRSNYQRHFLKQCSEIR